MARSKNRSRLITVVAIGFLLLDGILLGLAGLWSGRVGLVLLGGLFCVGAGLVWISWKKYQQKLMALNRALHARFVELQQLKRTLEESADEDYPR